MNKEIEKFPVHIPQHQRAVDNTYYEELSSYFQTSIGAPLDKLRSFTKYTPVAEINRFLAKNEIFKKILNLSLDCKGRRKRNKTLICFFF